MPDKYDSTIDTLAHIKRVRELLFLSANQLLTRSLVHDDTKLESPEKELFDEFTPKLKYCTYGSDEYKGFLKGLKVALDHHYENNSHHPEHYKLWKCPVCENHLQESETWLGVTTNGDGTPTRFCLPCTGGTAAIYECSLENSDRIVSMDGMDLFDLLEMMVDWKAATERHDNGDMYKSLEINKERFSISPQLISILKNTVDRYLK